MTDTGCLHAHLDGAGGRVEDRRVHLALGLVARQALPLRLPHLQHGVLALLEPADEPLQVILAQLLAPTLLMAQVVDARAQPHRSSVHGFEGSEDGLPKANVRWLGSRGAHLLGVWGMSLAWSCGAEGGNNVSTQVSGVFDAKSGGLCIWRVVRFLLHLVNEKLSGP